MMGLPAHKLSARIQVAALLVVGQDQRAALRQETLNTLERESTVGARRLDEAIAHPRSALLAPTRAVARPEGMPARATAQGFVTARRIVLDADAPGEDLLQVEHAPSLPFSSLFDSTYPKLVIAAVLLTLLVGGAGILVIRAQLRPLARLPRAARRLAAGDHAATLPEASGTTEVATLTRAFREMRNAIAQRELVLRELKRELEARMVARGKQILETACRQAAWHARGLALSMAMNVSACQFAAEDLAVPIAALLDRHTLPPGALQPEITESTLMANPDEAAETLRALRDLGVAVAVDDFGTSYASLTYLRRLSTDALKIDRSFVIAADHSEDDAQLVRTIVALAHSLHLELVAEGVENAAQEELLRTAGCTRLQGHPFCHPLAANALEAWLERLDPPGQALAA